MKVKPLEWTGPRWSGYSAKTEFGEYLVLKTAIGTSCSFGSEKEAITVYYEEGGSIENAKQAAETHWQERVKRCLID